MRLRRLLLLAVIASLVAGAAGCFSTNPPEPSGSNEPGDEPGTFTVTGLVQKRLGTGDFEPALNWAIAVTFFGRDRNNDGEPDHLDDENVRTRGAGVYEALIRSTEVELVEVKAIRCDYDENNPAPKFTCCLLPNPCPGGCESPFTTSQYVEVASGQTRVQQNLVVNCAN